MSDRSCNFHTLAAMGRDLKENQALAVRLAYCEHEFGGEKLLSAWVSPFVVNLGEHETPVSIALTRGVSFPIGGISPCFDCWECDRITDPHINVSWAYIKAAKEAIRSLAIVGNEEALSDLRNYLDTITQRVDVPAAPSTANTDQSTATGDSDV